MNDWGEASIMMHQIMNLEERYNPSGPLDLDQPHQLHGSINKKEAIEVYLRSYPNGKEYMFTTIYAIPNQDKRKALWKK